MPTSPDPCRGLNESKVRELRRQAMAEPVLLNYLVGESAVEGVAHCSRVGMVVVAIRAVCIKPRTAAEAVAQIRRRAAHGVRRISCLRCGRCTCSCVHVFIRVSEPMRVPRCRQSPARLSRCPNLKMMALLLSTSHLISL